MNRYFVYCRKSTDDEGHQVLSIESQLSELKKLIEREHFQIVEWLQEARSAKVPGRVIFNDMIRRIERGEANGIIAWHPDRLARNALDGGRIIHLVDAGILVDLKFPTYGFDNSPQGKFNLGISFVQSKYYVDSLSENIRRGNRTKRERGWITGPAPIGYLNARSETGEKILAPDPERYPILKKLWVLFLSGGYSLPQLQEHAAKVLALKTRPKRRRGGKPLSVSSVYRVFSNPFYAGHIRYKDQWLPGRHQAMISLDEFNRAQVLLGRVDRPRPKTHTFPYTGLIRCGSCGCGVTAENKMNRHGSRYVYYHCTRKKPGIACVEPSIERTQLEEQIIAFLESITIDKPRLDQLLELIEKDRTESKSEKEAARATIDQALDRCVRSLANLTEMRYRELITEEEFVQQRADLKQEQATLKQRLERVSAETWIEPARNLFFFSHRAKFWLVHGTEAEKRLILSTVGSNLFLKSKKLSIDAKKPFRILSDKRDVPLWWTVVNDVRTLFESESCDSIPSLPEPVILTPKSP